MFSSKTLIYFRLKKIDMDILDDMGVSKLSAIFFLKVNYSFKVCFSDLSNTYVMLKNANESFKNHSM